MILNKTIAKKDYQKVEDNFYRSNFPIIDKNKTFKGALFIYDNDFKMHYDAVGLSINKLKKYYTKK